MTEYKAPKKKQSQYDQIRKTRQNGLVQELQQYILRIKVAARIRFEQQCRKRSIRNGQLDEIDEKVCLRKNQQMFKSTLVNILPELTEHSINYQQCLEECEKNHISYVIANQSCRGVYEKNFKKSANKIAQTILNLKLS